MGRDLALTLDSDAPSALRGYLALPAAGRGPAVLVLGEGWGLVDHIRDVCDRLAREGFVALAPDLYRGVSASDPTTAERLMLGLDLERAGADLDAAVRALLSRDEATGARIGCIGFCRGGQLALYAGTRNPRIGAVVDCYGIHPNVTLDFTGMRAAVLGVFAENDDSVPPAVAHALAADLRAAGVRADIRVHVGVTHAFLDDSRPEVYDAPSAREAWNDILVFLRAELA